ncbi:hypothetical protein [Pseudobutyrivibrio xylanivorans]|uniref:VCBS repeat-containing protein n=1 Tax=Pseudobutyrivibrio xylanivorans TaxID=185007 RepID=A0A1G5S658_PSEXY|nr:hypothetical protein [Pseudobutyrivibrio xylanivorans]SCZ81567.1 hypothetical protein SAMN02910350_02880 [Pseudobutyrivibrio xylanivorans]
MENRVLIMLMLLCLSLAGCGKQTNSETTALVDSDSSVSSEGMEDLSDAELNELDVIVNDPKNMVVIQRPFNSYSEYEEYSKELIVEDEAIGTYKCVSGTKQGNQYNVRIEVTDGDDWSEVVFPSRDVTFIKDGDNIQYISNIFDWAEGCVKEQSFELDLPQYDGKTCIYTYENVPDFEDKAFIYVINNGKKVDRISTERFENDKIVSINTVEAINNYDYDADGNDDFIIIGKDKAGTSHLLIMHYDAESDMFYSEDELSAETEKSISVVTVADVKDAL